MSNEVEARLSYDTEATIAKGRYLISECEKAGISRDRILIKVERDIATGDSLVRVPVIHTREDWAIARDCYRLFHCSRQNSPNELVLEVLLVGSDLLIQISGVEDVDRTAKA